MDGLAGTVPPAPTFERNDMDNTSDGKDEYGPDQCLMPNTYWKCPNMKEAYSDMEGERYRCGVCGRSYYLGYEEMK